MPPIRSRKDHGPYEAECARLPRNALPYSIQHTLLTAVQRILEEAIFYFVRHWCPSLLQEQGWDTPEAGELNTWWTVLNPQYGRIPPGATQFHHGYAISILFGRLSHLRHASVHRKVATIEIIKRMMIDAVELADGLKDFTRRNKLRCIELAIYDADVERLQRITQKPLEAFVDFNYPGCRPGSMFDTARRPPQYPYALEAPKAMFPRAPIAPAPPPVGKMPLQKRKSSPPLPGRSGKSHPNSNTHSQVRARDRAAPYLISREFSKKAKSCIGHLIDLTGDGENDLGLVGVSKINPVDLTIDTKKKGPQKKVGKVQLTAVKVPNEDPFSGNPDFIPLADVKSEDGASGIYIATPAGSESPAEPPFEANNIASAKNTSCPLDQQQQQQQQHPQSDTGLGDFFQHANPTGGLVKAVKPEQAQSISISSGQQHQYQHLGTRFASSNFVQQRIRGGGFSPIQAQSANDLPTFQKASRPFGELNHQEKSQAATGFGGIVRGQGLFSQIQAKPTGTGSIFSAPTGSQLSVGTQEPTATEGLSVPVSENHKPNPPANSMGLTAAANNPQTAQEQPFFTQMLSIPKRAPNTIINRFRTPSPLPEGNCVPALRQTSGNVPGSFSSSSSDTFRGVDTKTGSQFQNFRSRVEDPDDSD